MDALERLLDIEQRLRYIESLPWLRCEGVHNTAYPVNNQAIADTASLTTASLYGAYGIPLEARGIVGMLRGSCAAAAGCLMIDSADDVPDLYSCLIEAFYADAQTIRGAGLVWVRLGLVGATLGKVTIKATKAWAGVYLSIVGYWL
jgi:hypothetical protein